MTQSNETSATSVKKSAEQTGRKVKRATAKGFSKWGGEFTAVDGINFATDEKGRAYPAFALKTAKAGGFIGDFPAAGNLTFTAAAIPSEYGGGVIYRDPIAVSEDGKLYRYNEISCVWEEVEDVSFDKKPKIEPYFETTGKESAVFFGNKVYAYTVGGDVTEIAPFCYKGLGCVASDRVFFAETDKTVAFSGLIAKDATAESADEGGNISFPVAGGLRGVCRLSGYVYVFFAKRAFRLDARGAARDFSTKEVPYAGGEIICGSAVSCGDKICFAADDGGYVFDGEKFENFTAGKSEIDLLNAKEVRCAGVPGKFLFEIVKTRKNAAGASVIDENDAGMGEVNATSDENGGGVVRTNEEEEAATYVYDTVNKTMAKVNVSLTYACAYGDDAYVFEKGQLKRFVFDGSAESGREYRLERAEEDFGTAGRKTLRSVVLYGKGLVRLSVSGGCEARVYALELTERGVRADLKITAEKFSFGVILTDGAYLSGAEAEYSAFERSGRAATR